MPSRVPGFDGAASVLAVLHESVSQARDRDRTGDLILTKDALYRLSYASDPHHLRAGDGARTRDPQLGRLMLYQLSYTRDFVRVTAAFSSKHFSKHYSPNRPPWWG
jgi:hypothetical protein